MKSRRGCAFLLMILICQTARGDTVTTTDASSVNGSILGIADGVVKIKARFPSKTKEIWIPLKNVQSIEFNSQTFNAGAPPQIQGFGPSGSPAAQAKSDAGEVIVLRGGERQPCNLMDIDAAGVHCGRPDAVYPRNKVLRIVFGS